MRYIEIHFSSHNLPTDAVGTLQFHCLYQRLLGNALSLQHNAGLIHLCHKIGTTEEFYSNLQTKKLENLLVLQQSPFLAPIVYPGNVKTDWLKVCKPSVQLKRQSMSDSFSKKGYVLLYLVEINTLANMLQAGGREAEP